MNNVPSAMGQKWKYKPDQVAFTQTKFGNKKTYSLKELKNIESIRNINSQCFRGLEANVKKGQQPSFGYPMINFDKKETHERRNFLQIKGKVFKKSNKLRFWSQWNPLSKEIFECAQSGQALTIQKNMETCQNYELFFDHLMKVFAKGNKFKHLQEYQNLQKECEEKMKIKELLFKEKQDYDDSLKMDDGYHNYHPDQFLKNILDHFKNLESLIQTTRQTQKFGQEEEQVESYDDIKELVKNCSINKLRHATKSRIEQDYINQNLYPKKSELSIRKQKQYVIHNYRRKMSNDRERINSEKSKISSLEQPTCSTRYQTPMLVTRNNCQSTWIIPSQSSIDDLLSRRWQIPKKPKVYTSANIKRNFHSTTSGFGQQSTASDIYS